MNLPTMLKRPSAFLPVAMSLAALAAVSKTGASLRSTTSFPWSLATDSDDQPAAIAGPGE
jgi:hypothetical protein